MTHVSRSLTTDLWSRASCSTSAWLSTWLPTATCQSKWNSWWWVNAAGRSCRGDSSARSTALVSSWRTSDSGHLTSMRLASNVAVRRELPSSARASALTVTPPREWGSASRVAGSHHRATRSSMSRVGSRASTTMGRSGPLVSSEASNGDDTCARGMTRSRTTAASVSLGSSRKETSKA